MTLEPNRPAGPQPEPFQPVAPESAAVPTSPVTPEAGAVLTSPVTPPPVTVAAPPGPTRKASSGGRWLNLVLVVAAAVAIGGVAFAIGRGTAPASAATGNGPIFEGAFPGGGFVPDASGAPGPVRGGFVGALGGGLTVEGTIESVDGDTMTIKTANGQTITVSTDTSTTYHTQTDASASDVTAGKTVKVQLDGGITARPNASATTGGSVGTAGSVTVIP